MAFEGNTTLKYIPLAQMVKPTNGGLVTQDLPRSGILQSIHLAISAVVSGTVSTANANGVASILRRVRVSLNNGLDIYNISGVGYCQLLQDFIDAYLTVTPNNQGRSAVSAATFNLNMVIPIAINNRDQYGLILTQNDQSIATLSIDFEADANVILTGGGTYTCTVKPTALIFEVPADPANLPMLTVAHQILEDQQSVTGTADVTYQWPIGNTYLGVYHFLTSGFTRALLRAQQSLYIADTDPDSQSMLFERYNGRTNTLAGVYTGNNKRIIWDRMGSDGLGTFGTMRDPIASYLLSDLASVITPVGTGTLFSVKRQLVILQS